MFTKYYGITNKGYIYQQFKSRKITKINNDLQEKEGTRDSKRNSPKKEDKPLPEDVIEKNVIEKSKSDKDCKGKHLDFYI